MLQPSIGRLDILGFVHPQGGGAPTRVAVSGEVHDQHMVPEGMEEPHGLKKVLAVGIETMGNEHRARCVALRLLTLEWT